METTYADSVVEINLSNIAKNYQLLSSKLKAGTKAAAVVKANAYGLGVEKVAPVLEKVGCELFFVATLDEALELREILPSATIHVFHGLLEGQEATFIQHNITPVLNDMEQVARWQEAANKQEPALSAVLHIDTGMNRLGISFEESASLSKEDFAGLKITYIMSHLACSKEEGHPLTSEQLKRINNIRKQFEDIPISLANSGGTLLGECYQFDMVRLGVGLYGGSPAGQDIMHPVATLKSRIIQTRTLKEKATIGYSATIEVPAGRTLATLPIGYADGYIRSLSNNDVVAHINGKAVPVLGRVSMDLIVVDVTDIPSEEASVGCFVELFGVHQSITQIASKAGTIGYEILTRLGRRLRREYNEG
jgi:alanine racemase